MNVIDCATGRNTLRTHVFADQQLDFAVTECWDHGASGGVPRNDTVNAGASDLITLGEGHDTVAFGQGPNLLAIGNETINGFNATKNTIKFNPALLANYAPALVDTTQVGANTVIQVDATDSVTLVGVNATSLTASNFHFS